MKEQKTLIILDRDGVINLDSKSYIRSPQEWIPIPGSIEAIAQLSQSGFLIVVATNQSGLKRGYFDMAALNAIHKKMYQVIEEANGHIEAIFFCPHVDEDECECRKPKPGMYQEICTRFDVAPESAIVVGDSKRDLEAAWAIGCQAVLVLTGNGDSTLRDGFIPHDVSIYNNLLDFAEQMVAS